MNNALIGTEMKQIQNNYSTLENSTGKKMRSSTVNQGFENRNVKITGHR